MLNYTKFYKAMTGEEEMTITITDFTQVKKQITADMVYCWFSGGRDSALACYLAGRVAKVRGWGFKLVHIDTRTPRPREVSEYVRSYAWWLARTLDMRIDLDVVMPERSFAEYAAQYGMWPLLWHVRWCYYKLKREPVMHYLRSEPGAINGLHVFAIRREESLFREREYRHVYGVKCYDENLCIRYWLPLLYTDSLTLDRLIALYNIPRSPVWERIGTSGECLCLAGTSYKTLVRIAIHYPSVAVELAEIDDVIQANRRKGASYPAPLIDKRITLRQWLERFMRQPKLDNYTDNYTGKGCQGSCIL